MSSHHRERAARAAYAPPMSPTPPAARPHPRGHEGRARYAGEALPGRLVRILAFASAPRTIARLVWLLGAVSVLSAAFPAVHERVRLVTQLVPRVFPAAATTGTLAAGVALMLLAGGLRRGKFRAWLLATALSGFAVVAHLVKGLDVEEAVLSAAVMALLLTARHRFTARPDPRSPRRIVALAVLGLPLASLLGFVWVSVDLDGIAPGSTAGQRLAQAFLGLAGIPGPVSFVDAESATRAGVGLAVLGASLVLLLLVAALQPANGPHRLDDEDRQSVRTLLARWGEVDSLSWFALRADRTVVFAPDSRAAVSYRVVGGVSMAAGDPLGDPRAWPGAIAAWLGEADAYGWLPGVLGASEEGAEAYHRAGLDALELGDEAVLHTADFTTEGRQMRGIRQAVARCHRAGLSTICVRVRDLDDADRAAIVARAEAWRDGEVERGFSMALGRLADPADGDAVMVLCRDASGELRGLLQLVPWGADGLSLDVMRRDHAGANGLVELMVSDLMARAPAMGVDRVSLNFAVFRSVLARGDRVGAGPVLRLWRAILLQASRYWQIESLYRANAKFHPEWTPRFVCFRSVVDVPSVCLAALRAEAFLVAPAWWRDLGERRRRPRSPVPGGPRASADLNGRRSAGGLARPDVGSDVG